MRSHLGQRVELEVFEDHLAQALLHHVWQIRLYSHAQATLLLIELPAKTFQELLLPQYMLQIGVLKQSSNHGVRDLQITGAFFELLSQLVAQVHLASLFVPAHGVIDLVRLTRWVDGSQGVFELVGSAIKKDSPVVLVSPCAVRIGRCRHFPNKLLSILISIILL